MHIAHSTHTGKLVSKLVLGSLTPFFINPGYSYESIQIEMKVYIKPGILKEGKE